MVERSQGYSPPKTRVPSADGTDNDYIEEVVGQKDDAAVEVVDTASTMMAFLKGVLNILGATGVQDVVLSFGPFGNQVVQQDVDDEVRYSVYLVNPGGDILANAETAPGTYTVRRVRAGTDTEITAATAATEAAGVISALIDFTDGNWADGDLGYIEFSGITATPTSSGVTTALPIMRRSFRVTQEVTMEAKIDTIDASLGYDGATDYASGFNEFSVAGVGLGAHDTVSVLFVIPEAVGSINAHNSVILTELQKLGHVDTITQADALTYPHFAEYNIIVCGTDNGTPWTTSNLAHIKEFPEPVICVDATVAAYLLIGADGGDAASKTAMVAIDQIKANDLGIGITGFAGLEVGANTISSAATYNTLDMSAADITETFFGTETTADPTDVLLAAVFKRQPDGGRGILSDGAETPGSRYFYGPAYSASALNTLGLAVLELLGHMAIQATTAALGVEISGDIGDIERKLFGNQASAFNNGNPLVEFVAGRNSVGTRNPVGKSLFDLLGDAYLAAGGGLGTDSILSDLGLIHSLIATALHQIDFWSDVEDLLTITNAAQDLALPDIVVADLPAGATVVRAVLMLKYRTVEDTSAGINKLDDNAGGNTPAIQVRDDTPGSWTDGINMLNDSIQVPASTREGGDILIGDNDVAAEVDGNDTYNVQFDDAEADGNNLLLRDVQVGLRLWYKMS